MSFIASPLSFSIKDNSIFTSFIQGLLCRLAKLEWGGGRVEIKDGKHRLIDFVGKGRELLLENKT